MICVTTANVVRCLDRVLIAVTREQAFLELAGARNNSRSIRFWAARARS